MKLQFRLGPLRHYCPGEALVLAEAHQMLSKLKRKIFLNQLGISNYSILRDSGRSENQGV